MLAIVIAFWGRYDQILNYVVSMDFIFFGLTACCVFVFRKRGQVQSVRTPAHPVTTLLFVIACWAVVINTVIRYPNNTLIGMAILALGVPAYFLWRLKAKQS
jgi:APA family basic amino acid/polyamine antiporter